MTSRADGDPPDASSAAGDATGADSLASYLRARDVTCPGCGYNLRGLSASVCPECRQELELRVGLAEPKLGLWLASVVGAACGLGFNTIFLMLFAALRVMGDRGGPRRGTLILFVGGAIVFGLVTHQLLRSGRRVRRFPVVVRVLILSAVLAMVGVNLTLLVFGVRNGW